jgi:hypothetical protein
MKSGGSVMKKISALFLLFSTTLTFAQNLTFGDFLLKGSGCKEGTYSVTTSPDQQSVSLIFDEFRVEVPQYNNNNDNAEIRRTLAQNRKNEAVDHKACHISFSSEVPNGEQVESIEISLNIRGSTVIDEGLEATYSAILVGMRGTHLNGNPRSITLVERKLWRLDSIAEDWYSDKKIIVPVSTKCHQGHHKVYYDLKNHLTAQILDNNLNKSGLVSVDSQDMTGALKIKVNTKKCDARVTPGNGNPPPRPHPRRPR